MHKPGAAKKGARQSVRFVRRKPLTDRLLALPLDLLDYLSPWLDPVEYLTDPALGYPIGGLLHLLSLVAIFVNPTSQLSFSAVASAGRGQLLGGQGTPRQSLGLGGVRAKKALESRRWLSITLLVLTLLLSLANAIYLFTKTRQYKLWMRSEDEKLRSDHAHLVPLELDQDEGKGWVEKAQERAIDFGLAQLQRVPIIGWFTPAPHRTRETSAQAQIHVLEVWEAPVVQMRTFVIFSPLHALFYILAAPLLALQGPLAWLTALALMTGFSVQSWTLMKSYNGLVKDRGLLSAEVMREYDEKFVFPRAMPAVRDASTQTSEAETISWRDLHPSHHHSTASYHPSPTMLQPVTGRWASSGTVTGTGTSTGGGAGVGGYTSTDSSTSGAAARSASYDSSTYGGGAGGIRRRTGTTGAGRRSVVGSASRSGFGEGFDASTSATTTTTTTTTPRKGRKSIATATDPSTPGSTSGRRG